MNRVLLITLMLLCSFRPGAAAEVGPALDGPRVVATLLAEVSHIRPGETFWVGVHQQIDPGWHTYWRNPGDSGAPTTLTWQLPAGFSASDIRWPYPERIPYGPLMNFGYHDEVLLLVAITVPVELASSEVTLRADGTWLVCEEICIPESGVLELTMPVHDGPVTKNPDNESVFAAARLKMPQDVPIDSAWSADQDVLTLSVGMPAMAGHRITNVDYFPWEDGVIDYPAPQAQRFTDSGFEIGLAPGWQFDPTASSLEGIVVLTEIVGGEALRTALIVRPVSDGRAVNHERPAAIGLLAAVAFAFLGGMILNLMPCVFPVLSIKVLALVENHDHGAGAIRLHGFAYLAGVVLSFVAVAAVLLALRGAGSQIGWGFQLQSPVVVGLLAYLFVLIGLNLSGYFEIGLSWMNTGDSLAARGGYGGSFFTGALATVVAAPCTAPFMGAAIGFAVTQGAISALLVFASLGAGMATPFLLLCFSPTLLRRLPRPGIWMVKFKELLAFPMFASAIWLTWVLALQTGASGVLIVLCGMLSLGFGIWLARQFQGAGTGRWLGRAAAVVLILGAPALLIELPSAKMAQPSEGSSVGQSTGHASGPVAVSYSEATLAEARRDGPVFVNFTAAWCITCKVNELAALRSDRIRQAFEQRRVRYLKGDWTNEDPVITNALARYGRSGVPLYLLFPGGEAEPTVLPQILTQDLVLDALEAVPD
ncbi:MAG: protein-disulfide reductase DsbD family protein [Proteobacteria bacterium]|jgi:thiol:disulfide interchange protein/DsbC/DsbD-like thiol-disulfide interchange protein|nr:protein-disulfide reductase DsbD family protein [Pseudomonadota bacterium]